MSSTSVLLRDADVELGKLPDLSAKATTTPGELYASLPVQTQSRCIRVLDLDSVPALSIRREKYALTGRLRVVRLQDCPRFAALSYVWGGYSTPKDVIHCNGGADIEITANCRDALVALRKRYGRVTIWVDAICIHQQDSKEKNGQIPLMEEIYSWAEHVFIWLGPDDKSSTKAIRWLRRASYGSFFDALVRMASVPVSEKRSRHSLALVLCVMGCAVRDILSILGSIVPIWSCLRRRAWDPPFESMEALFSRSYFSRAWTFQEVLLAWDITLLCGNRALDWGHLLGGLEYYYNPGEEAYKSYKPGKPELAPMKDLVESWMHITRPTHWNDREIRRSILANGDSADGYQKTAASLFFQTKGFRLLKLWYYAVAFAVFFTAISVLGLLLIVIPLSSGEYQDRLLALTIGDLGLSAFFALGCIRPPSVDRRHGIFSRCHLRLGFGNPGRDATAVQLSGIIRAIREREATEPKDRSYATHGLLTRLGVPLSSVDYRKSLGRVYQDLFTDMLRWDPDLIRLILDARDGAFPDSPSWVPNWNALRESLAATEYILSSSGTESVATSSHNLSIDGPRLTVAISWKDTVHHVSDPFRPVDSDRLLKDSVYFGSSWSQIFFLARWMALFRKPGQGNVLSGLDNGSASKTSQRESGGWQNSAPYEHRAAHDLIDEDRSANIGWIGSNPTYDNNWYRLVDMILPALAKMGNESASSRFRAFHELIRTDPDAGLSESDRGRDMSSHLEAVEVLAREITKNLAGRKQLLSTRLGIPGSLSKDVHVKSGDLVARVHGIYWPLILRRTETALNEYRVIGYVFVPEGWREATRQTDDRPSLETIVLV